MATPGKPEVSKVDDDYDEEMEEFLSDCCGATPFYEYESGICGQCKEHCDFTNGKGESYDD